MITLPEPDLGALHGYHRTRFSPLKKGGRSGLFFKPEEPGQESLAR